MKIRLDHSYGVDIEFLQQRCRQRECPKRRGPGVPALDAYERCILPGTVGHVSRAHEDVASCRTMSLPSIIQSVKNLKPPRTFLPERPTGASNCIDLRRQVQGTIAPTDLLADRAVKPPSSWVHSVGCGSDIERARSGCAIREAASERKVGSSKFHLYDRSLHNTEPEAALW